MAGRSKLHVRKGDLVEVISGKYKNVRGKVIAAFPKQGKVIVEKVNIVARHQKPRGINQPGGIIRIEAPIYASKVMLVCTKCNQRTRVGHKILEDGTKVRVCKKCGETFND
ncbi:50S ribosomal protein L24 [Caldicoprobacter algeriensis]|uniref:50S ribosomal protein L24 n=1 Tax=Caldicoprobacter algeriensis TaxID=699281 RepID=UPI0020796AAB|nr:50S ribosomal protein L24 [Caldicoprobacter algeriensis]MCM8900376.1 50S ribosomal protein L24 [Caldicoprobacter algeriensis]